jgi:aminomethyltransferase
MALRYSPLDATHRDMGAKMVPFAGWEMPLHYQTGTLAEHRSCRTDAVAFDVSHLGSVRVTNSGAYASLQEAFTNDLGKIGPGRAQYTHLLDAFDGSVLDDLIVWWIDDERFDVMPNASNTARVLEAIGGDDVTATRAVLAVQGPEARARLAKLADAAAAVKRFRVAQVEIAGADCIVAGTGYTGEDGVEIAVPSAAATTVWEAVLSAGVVAAGLGARDTLRLEAGLPLHGHELGPGITPLQANLEWVVAWSKSHFRGRSAVMAERERGVRRRIRGLEVNGKRPPRAGHEILLRDEVVGRVTSGNFSPMLDRGIALGFLPPQVDDGIDVGIDIRGTTVSARVVPTPFYRSAH